VVPVDEVAFLTAYQTDRKLRERVMNALATLTTQGRAVDNDDGEGAAGVLASAGYSQLRAN
jgi:hypothetical protein